MANVCPDRPNQRDNHSSDSSDAESVGHWDTNWAEQRCHACGKRGHTSWSCDKKARGELYYLSGPIPTLHTGLNIT